MIKTPLKRVLDDLYRQYNRREYVCTDPLEFLFGYDDFHDREIVGFITAALAYGRVQQINRSVAIILERMMPSPSRFLLSASPAVLRGTFSDFKHRFTTGDEMVAMLCGIRGVLQTHGSLCNGFQSVFDVQSETILPALTAFVAMLTTGSGNCKNSLLPQPNRGSACKRLNLYLRWMVRHDDVDPGGWRGIPASKLVVPLDTHLHRMCLALGFTERRQADIKTALEITAAFRTLDPDDPVKYDFALTRLGICNDVDFESFFGAYGMCEVPFSDRRSLSA